jgi:Bacterial SH3 domain
MIRRAAIIVLALTLNPALVRAQETGFTISAPSAEVRKGPSTVNPIIGHVSRGTVVPVVRNLGSWIKIAWPDAEDGVGYVHITTGHIGPLKAAAPSPSASPARSAAPAAAAPAVPSPPRTPEQRVTHRVPVNVTPASHIFGVGGLVGSMNNFGATARAWRNNGVGVQLGVTRDAMASDAAAGRVTSMQVEPGVVYAFADDVSDYIWTRAYLGSSVNVNHQTLNVSAPVALPPTSDNSVGFRVFGGAELTFASVPRFGLSVDVGYRRIATPFAGFDASPLSVAVAGHWYVK